MSRIPVTVLSGFLGSGKTTLLNHLLQADHGFKAAVIVNEFGSVGVDGKLVPEGEQFVELDNGCLCCALNEDLEKTVRTLASRGGFDHLILETTGVADPLPVAWTFQRPGLSQKYRLDAIVTVVDAANVEQAIDDTAEVKLQIERADLLILNKRDLVSRTAFQRVTERIRAHNDSAPLLPAEYGRVDWGLVLTSDRPARIQAEAERGKADEGHAHGASFQTWTWPTSGFLDDETFEAALYELPDEVYRLKGLIRTTVDARWRVVNMVAGRFEVSPLPAAAQARLRSGSGCLVFIGKSLDVTTLRRWCNGLKSVSRP